MIEVDHVLTQLQTKSSLLQRTFPLVAVTPLLMHGWQETYQDNSGRSRNRANYAETRVPSIKGVMRYWWRALQHDECAQGLYQREAVLFGGAGNDNTTRSPVLLSLRAPPVESQWVSIRPHNPERGKALASRQTQPLS